MQETWTTRHSDIELDGYSHPIHSFRRFQNKRASGGLIIYIKDNIRKGVKLIKNEVDCLIWLKFDKCFFQFSEDIYLCVAYIPPENSVFHNMFDGDIFRLLEDDISFYHIFTIKYILFTYVIQATISFTYLLNGISVQN